MYDRSAHTQKGAFRNTVEWNGQRLVGVGSRPLSLKIWRDMICVILAGLKLTKWVRLAILLPVAPMA